MPGPASPERTSSRARGPWAEPGAPAFGRYPVPAMRLSKLFVPTLRDDPADAEIASHRLLLRAGFIRRLTAGIYSYLPLALRVMRTIEDDRARGDGGRRARSRCGCRSCCPRSRGRRRAAGRPTATRSSSSRIATAAQMMLGPTEEEVFAPLVAGDLPSYRDLPINLFQVEWKYRDEKRPRFGLLRGREFLMKDAYSFDRDEEGMRESYRIMYEAYERMFDRLGLDHEIVEADPGTIGGGINHEFMALADVGEDLFVRCVNGDYLADTEAATPQAPTAARRGRARGHGRGRHPRRGHDRARRDAARRRRGLGTLKNIMFDVDADGRGRARARRPRGEPEEARQAAFPEGRARLRRRRLRATRLRQGLRRPAGVR